MFRSSIVSLPDYPGDILGNILLIHSSNYCVGFLSLVSFSLLSTPCLCVISSANTKSTTICLLMTHRYTSLLQTNLLMSKLKSELASLTSPHVYVSISSNPSWIKQFIFSHTLNLSFSVSSKHKSRFKLKCSPYTKKSLVSSKWALRLDVWLIKRKLQEES